MSLTAEKGPALGAKVFDLVERAFLLVLSLTAIVRLAPQIGQSPYIALLLISEGLAVAFILLRKAGRRSRMKATARPSEISRRAM